MLDWMTFRPEHLKNFVNNENSLYQFGVKSARSLIKEFSTFLQLELSCILDEANNYLEAADVKWSLDNLLAAYNSRLDIESNNSQY